MTNLLDIRVDNFTNNVRLIAMNRDNAYNDNLEPIPLFKSAE